jgi:hypothetical protein
MWYCGSNDELQNGYSIGFAVATSPVDATP